MRINFNEIEPMTVPGINGGTEGERMTEWEKLQAGLMYDDFSEELFGLRIQAKKLFSAYNATNDEEPELRRELLGRLLGHVGEGAWIEPDFRCEYGRNISIGERAYLNFGAVILDCAPVEIGDDVLIGPNLGIYAVNHSLVADERVAGACVGAPVRIGDRAWLGGDVKVLAGVTIGAEAVVGAGSVVTRDVPAGMVAVGNPCRVLREITDADRLGFPGRTPQPELK